MARKESLDEQTKKAFQEDPRLAIFAGEGAATADLEMLALAKAKTNEGEDPRKIWRDTGWWKAKDGKWRFEIDDRAASIVDGQIVHAELEKAYPGVFDEIKVSVEPLEEGLFGSFDPNTKKLKVSSKLSAKDQLDTALHELQHYVQEKEGFESGSNPLAMAVYNPKDPVQALKSQRFNIAENFTTYSGKSKEEIAKDLKQKTGFETRDFIIESPSFKASSVLRHFFQYATKEQIEKLTNAKFDDAAWQRMSKARESGEGGTQFLVEAYKSKYPEQFLGIETYKDLENYQSPSLSYSEGFDMYESVLGEAEARGVPVRKEMEPEQRRISYPEDTYLLPEVGVPYEEAWTRPTFEPAFAQGGMVDYNTETQMNRLMQEGGIADDGMRRDPVSGNEVPPGSMAEEVRDDIPAQLSSGEYVVPADVLRYYGVAFFEKLRAEAKRGLSEMEAGGRIGGEPVEMEDDLPFDVSELQTSGGDNTDMQMAQMGMAQGGVVKMQEGGAMTQPATSTFNPAQYQTVGGSYFQTGAAPTHEYRVYQNAQGQTISILFINGVAQQPIPEGYFPQGQAPQVQQPTPSDSGNDRDERPPEPVKSFSEYTAEDWVKYKPDSGIGGKLGQIAGGVIGGAFLGPAGALLGAKGMEEAMARNSINAYNAFNDFVGSMNVNDPNYAELAKKRNDIFGELTAKQEEDPGLFTRIVNEIFGTTEIAKPKGGGGRSTGGGGGGRTAGGGGGAASSRDEGAGAVVTPVTTSRAASAPARGGRGTGATATRGTSTTRVRDVTALEGPEAASVTQRKAEDQKLGAGARGAAQGGLMVKARVAKKAAKKRPIKTTDA
jgi:hypothetical protein